MALNTPNGLLELDFRRGFVAVDATVGDKDYRFVITHLEVHEPAPGNPLSRFFRAAQAAELIATLAATTPAGLTLIVVSDINSSPEHEPVPGPLPLPEPFDLGIVPMPATPISGRCGPGRSQASPAVRTWIWRTSAPSSASGST